MPALVCAAPWGAGADFDEQAVSGSPSANPSGVESRYLLPQVVAGKGKDKKGVAFSILYTPSCAEVEKLILRFKKDGSLSDSSFSPGEETSRSAAAYPGPEGTAVKNPLVGDRGSESVGYFENRQKEEALREWYLRQ